MGRVFGMLLSANRDIAAAEGDAVKIGARAAPYMVKASPAKKAVGKAMSGCGAADTDDFDGVAPPTEYSKSDSCTQTAAAVTPAKRKKKTRRAATAGEHLPTSTPGKSDAVIGGGGAASASAAALTPSSALARQLHLEEMELERKRKEAEDASEQAAREEQQKEAHRLAEQLRERVVVPWQKPRIKAEDDPERQSVRIEVFLPLLDTLAVHQIGGSGGDTGAKGGSSSLLHSSSPDSASSSPSGSLPPSGQSTSGRPELVVAATPDLSSFREHQEYLPESMRVTIPRLQLDVHVVGKKDFRSDDVTARYDPKTGVCVLRVRGARLAGGAGEGSSQRRGMARGKGSKRSGASDAAASSHGAGGAGAGSGGEMDGRPLERRGARGPGGSRRLRRVSMFRMDRGLAGSGSTGGSGGGLRRVEESEEEREG